MTSSGSAENLSPINPDLPLIIIADDDPSMRLMLHHVIEKEHYQALEASNGQEALKLCEQYKPDLVLLDAVMPEQDGFITCKIIKETTPELPVIIITGLDDDQSVEQAFNYGADEYITKPINWSVLKHRITQTLQLNDAVKQKPESLIEKKIIKGEYQCHYIPHIDLANETPVAIEATFLTKNHELNLLLDIDDCLPSFSLSAIEKLLTKACMDYQQIADETTNLKRLIFPLLATSGNPLQYVDMICRAVQNAGTDIRDLEFKVKEHRLQDKNIQALFAEVSKLPVAIIIGGFSFSIHVLDKIRHNYCTSIELDIPLIYGYLESKSEKDLAQQMLKPYLEKDIKVIAAGINTPEELGFAKLINCVEAHGNAMGEKIILDSSVIDENK